MSPSPDASDVPQGEKARSEQGEPQREVTSDSVNERAERAAAAQGEAPGGSEQEAATAVATPAAAAVNERAERAAAAQGEASTRAARAEGRPRSDARHEWLPASAPAPRPVWAASEERWTVRWVAFLFILSFGLWGAAKVACNYHPLTSLNFKPVPLEALTDRPKNAALEFHHALNTGDVETARRLARPSAVAWLEEQLRACGAECRQRKQAWSPAANTRAELHFVRGQRAEVSAETHYQGSMIAGRYLVVREGQQWKVGRRLEGGGEPNRASPSVPLGQERPALSPHAP